MKKYNHYSAVVEPFNERDSFVWMKLPQGRIAARRWHGVRTGEKAEVTIQPENVLLSAEHPGKVSARNVLPGRVVSLKNSMGWFYVKVDVGFDLTSLVSRQAARDLGIKKGSFIYAIFKAAAVSPNKTSKPKIRVSIVGKNGIISHGKIDFLKAVDATSSITSAGLESGITYRSAWLWAESINKIWGKPLVTKIQGGKGGGGALLTAEAKYLIKFAQKIEGKYE